MRTTHFPTTLGAVPSPAMSTTLLFSSHPWRSSQPWYEHYSHFFHHTLGAVLSHVMSTTLICSITPLAHYPALHISFSPPAPSGVGTVLSPAYFFFRSRRLLALLSFVPSPPGAVPSPAYFFFTPCTLWRTHCTQPCIFLFQIRAFMSTTLICSITPWRTTQPCIFLVHPLHP